MSRSPAEFFRRVFSTYDSNTTFKREKPSKQAKDGIELSSTPNQADLDSPVVDSGDHGGSGFSIPPSLASHRSSGFPSQTASQATMPFGAQPNTSIAGASSMPHFMGNEKAQKKVRLLVDQTQKPKYRLAALQSIIQSSAEHEQVRLFKDYATPIISLAVEMFNGFVEKSSSSKEFRDRFEKTITKEMSESFPVPYIYYYLIRLLGADLAKTAQYHQLGKLSATIVISVNILRSMLHPENHPFMRREGLKLLVLWLREEHATPPEIMQLFTSLVPLKLFIQDNVEHYTNTLEHQSGLSISTFQIDQEDFPLSSPNEPPLVPTNSPSSPAEQALLIFQDFLQLITQDPNPDRKSLDTLYGLFRIHYLAKLYPTVDFQSEYQSNTSTQSSNPFFKLGCPVRLQVIIIKYIAIWIVRNPELFTGRLGQEILGGDVSKTPIAALMMDELLMSSPANVELVHEIIRQVLLLPFSYIAHIKIAIAILRAWLFQPKDRRPEFLQKSTNLPPIMSALKQEKPTMTSNTTTTIQEETSMTLYVQRYISLLLTIFNGRPSVHTPNEQNDLYQEVLFFYRGLSMEAFFALSPGVWESLLLAPLQIIQTHLTGPNKYLIISTPQIAEDFSQLLSETLFGLLMRSQTKAPEIWSQLANFLSQSTRWPHVIIEWTKVVDQLTVVFSESIFGISSNAIKEFQHAMLKRPRIGSIEPEAYFLFDQQHQPLETQGSPLLILGDPLITSSTGLASPFSEASTGTMSSGGNTSASGGGTKTIDAFLTWPELSWTKQNIIFLWRNILRILGDPNAIERPDLHEIAIACLARTTERLMIIRAMQPYQVTSGKGLPPIYEMAPIFFDAVDLNPKLFERSRCRAFRQLSRLFFRRIDQPFPDVFYARLYLCLLSGLADKDDLSTAVIMDESRRLFGLFLPGSLVLLPSYVKTMAGMLNGILNNKELISAITRIASSIAILPSVYEETMPLARVEAPLAIMSQSVGISAVGETNLKDVKSQAIQIMTLLDMQEITHKNPESHGALLNAVTVLLLNELISEQIPNDSHVDALLGFLLNHIADRGEGPILPIAIDCLLSIIHAYPLFQKFGNTREILISQKLILTIRAGGDEALLGRFIMVLMEWFMTLSHDWLAQHQGIKDQLFLVLEDCLNNAIIAMNATFASGSVAGNIATGATGNYSKEGPYPTTTHRSSSQLSLGQIQPNPSNNAISGTNDINGSTSNMIAVGSGPNIVGNGEGSILREAAEVALVHLLHHMNNYAPIYGATVMTSQTEEPKWVPEGARPADKTLYFSFGENSIISVQQLDPIKSYADVEDKGNIGTNQGKQSQVRVILRNMAGRFTWDSQLFFDQLAHDLSIIPTTSSHDRLNIGESMNSIVESKANSSKNGQSAQGLLPSDKVKVVASAKPFRPPIRLGSVPVRKYKTIPDDPESMDLEQVDSLSELLKYISEEHPDCIPNGLLNSLVEPMPIPEDQFVHVKAVEKLCKERICSEVEACEPFSTAKQEPFQHPPISPCPWISYVTPFQYCRNFLASLGLIAPRHHLNTPIKLLPKSAAFHRELRTLDKRFNREVIKAGLIYVGSGQEEEMAILENTAGSNRYDEFVRGIAWQVDLKTHVGYSGGLEPAMTVTGTARYWCSSLVELIVHEAVNLACDPREDPKLVKKKRHIGNDAVLVVWNEHDREYRPTTIRGDFGNVVIVITPVPSANLYRINVWRDTNVQLFGPLFDGCMISRALLAPLVRITIINANRAINGKVPPNSGSTSTGDHSTPASYWYRHPFSTRATEIYDLIHRHAMYSWSLEQFLTQIIFAKGMLPEEQAFIDAELARIQSQNLIQPEQINNGPIAKETNKGDDGLQESTPAHVKEPVQSLEAAEQVPPAALPSMAVSQSTESTISSPSSVHDKNPVPLTSSEE